jgi:hypothetical protein
MTASQQRCVFRIFSAAIVIVLAACQLPLTPPWRRAEPAGLYTISTPFNEREFAGYDTSGNSSISGEAYMRVSGGIVLAAGSEVVLVPDTAYTRELWEPARSGRYSGVSNFDPRYFKYRRSTTADRNGYFRFTRLPAGTYIVQTHIPAIDGGKATFLHRRVTVDSSAAANVILSELNQQ